MEETIFRVSKTRSGACAENSQLLSQYDNCKKEPSEPQKDSNQDGNKGTSSESSTNPYACKDKSETFSTDPYGTQSGFLSPANDYYDSLVAGGYIVELKHIDDYHVQIIGHCPHK